MERESEGGGGGGEQRGSRGREEGGEREGGREGEENDIIPVCMVVHRASTKLWCTFISGIYTCNYCALPQKELHTPVITETSSIHTEP